VLHDIPEVAMAMFRNGVIEIISLAAIKIWNIIGPFFLSQEGNTVLTD
jgi:hypothetical protein